MSIVLPEDATGTGIADDGDSHAVTPLRKRHIPTWLDTVAVALLCCASFVVTMLTTRRGLGINNDSNQYVSAGLNLAQGRGLTTLYDLPLTVHAPALSTIVAAGAKFGVDDGLLLRIVNSLSFAAVVLLSYVLLRRHVSSRALVIGATAFIAISGRLLDMMARVLSEPLFFPIVLALILALEQLLARPRHVGWMVTAIGVSWLASLVRYTGFVLVPIGVVVLFIGLRSAGYRFAFAQSVIFGAGAAIAPVVWMFRNRAADGTLMGPREPAIEGPVTHVYRTLETFGRWFAIGNGGSETATVATIAGGLLLVVLGAAWCAGRTAPVHRAPSVLPLVAVCVGYAVYLIVAASMTRFNPLGSRFLLPVYVPLIVLATITVDRLRSRLNVPQRWLLAAAVVACLALQLSALSTTMARYADGQGYSARAWRESDLARAVSELPPDTWVFTNEPAGLWAQTRREGIRATPGRESMIEPAKISWFKKKAACQPTVLAWFTDDKVLTSAGRGKDRRLPPFDLFKFVDVELVEKANDGDLYRVLPDGTACKR